MEDSWKPIDHEDFVRLFNSQVGELSPAQRELFERFRVDIFTATIRRSDEYGVEKVYVVARWDNKVLYFDDVEYGFNTSEISESGQILCPGGSESNLQDAVESWFPRDVR